MDDPTAEGIYRVGVLANVLQLLKLPDGTVKVLVEGKTRVRITDFVAERPLTSRRAAEAVRRARRRRDAIKALIRAVAEEFERYAKIKKNIPEEALSAVSDTREPAASWPTSWRGISAIEVEAEAGPAGDARRRPSGWRRSMA